MLGSFADIKILPEFLFCWLELLREPLKLGVYAIHNFLMIVPLRFLLSVISILFFPVPELQAALVDFIDVVSDFFSVQKISLGD